jgi:hypothetical protein
LSAAAAALGAPALSTTHNDIRTATFLQGELQALTNKLGTLAKVATLATVARRAMDGNYEGAVYAGVDAFVTRRIVAMAALAAPESAGGSLALGAGVLAMYAQAGGSQGIVETIIGK